jgi:hypothetical protein
VTGLDDDAVTSGGVTLSVAAFCARGHHRSVAFVEDLATRAWPPEWEVRLLTGIFMSVTRARGSRGKVEGVVTGVMLEGFILCWGTNRW